MKMKGTWKVLKQALGQRSKSNSLDKTTYRGCEFTDEKKLQISAMSTLSPLVKLIH